jgi:hypothetical protein
MMRLNYFSINFIYLFIYVSMSKYMSKCCVQVRLSPKDILPPSLIISKSSRFRFIEKAMYLTFIIVQIHHFFNESEKLTFAYN